jgi:hypothetical protein
LAAFADAWRALYQPSMEEVGASLRHADILHRRAARPNQAEVGLEFPNQLPTIQLARHLPRYLARHCV